MDEELLESLVCSTDRWHPLALRAWVRTGRTIHGGELLCPHRGSRIEMVTGIPRFLFLEDSEAPEIKRREIAASDRTYRQRAIRELPVKRLRELDAIRSAVGDCRGVRVLDAGSGNGDTPRMIQRRSPRLNSLFINFGDSNAKDQETAARAAWSTRESFRGVGGRGESPMLPASAVASMPGADEPTVTLMNGEAPIGRAIRPGD